MKGNLHPPGAGLGTVREVEAAGTKTPVMGRDGKGSASGVGWVRALGDSSDRSDEGEPAVPVLDLGVDRLEKQGLDLLGDGAPRAVADLDLVDGADR